jgi:hypothetical protein
MADDYERVATLAEKDSQHIDDPSHGHHMIDRLVGGHEIAADRSA